MMSNARFDACAHRASTHVAQLLGVDNSRPRPTRSLAAVAFLSSVRAAGSDISTATPSAVPCGLWLIFVNENFIDQSTLGCLRTQYDDITGNILGGTMATRAWTCVRPFLIETTSCKFACLVKLYVPLFVYFVL